MASNVVTVTGIEETIAALKRIEAKVSKKIMRSAIRLGCRPILKAAKAAVPVETGALKKSLKIRVPKRKGRDEIVYLVSPDPKYVGEDGRKPSKYAHLVEGGTRTVVARPFLRSAFDAHKQQAIDKTKAALLRGIEREASRGGA